MTRSTLPRDSQGWTADFSGYSASESAKSLSLTFEHRLLPEEADQTGTALYLAGHNREQGDSLFMFVKRRVEDLPLKTTFYIKSIKLFVRGKDAPIR